MSHRIKDIQNHLSLVVQFDQALLKLSQWSETMLSNVHSAAQINISNLQSTVAHVKVRFIAIHLYMQNTAPHQDQIKSGSRMNTVLIKNNT